jgi:alanyl-tRNA synthetase
MTTAEIRQSFTGYFVRNNHKLLASSPVIPFDDPTILFTNAGMNQFKDIFTGRRKSEFPRATTVQKCLRAGGKHNDLDNVGFTARHHTFFEMLGNFSFGDYFKEEAIAYAWEWMTKELKLPVDRLYATVYESDDDAFALWGKIAPQLKNGRILRFGKKDNFWSMGDIGPCGPCSEIHFDRGEKYGVGPEHTVNGETDRFVEIWNLVFMQFNQPGDGTMAPLPKPSVDTGAGLERIAAIMQKVDSNYQIDLFAHIVRAISDVTHVKYADNVTSHHVIADHVRALTFCLADGAGISNEGRGYVLRRILRRAARHGRLLGMHEPFIYKIVPALVDQMGAAYPEIKEKQAHVQNVIKAEEESFLRTLDTGCELFDRVADKVKAGGGNVVPGEEIFKLYDTYGFPYDLTEIIATENDLVLDQVGFEKAMKEQQERSRAGSKFADDADFVKMNYKDKTLSFDPTRFEREKLRTEARIKLIDTVTGSGEEGWHHWVVLDSTPFYVESGGQVSDKGRIIHSEYEFSVYDVAEVNGYYFHLSQLVRGDANRKKAEDRVTAEVDTSHRWDIMRNHTVTHLTQAALRTVLGDQVKQSGSYVGPDYMRFDFSHHQPMTTEEIREVEQVVNGEIIKGHPVVTEVMDIESAKKTGAMALFGEKYGDTVRVVSIADVSKELCGGTHVANTGQIGSFVIVAESGIASGVRRIECITGRKATEYLLSLKQFRQQVSQTVNRPESEALEGVKQLRDANSELQKEVKKTKAAMFAGKGAQVGDEIQIGPAKLRKHDFGETDRETMAAWIDSQTNSGGLVLASATGVVGGTRNIIIAASAEAVQKLPFHSGSFAKELLPRLGGRGGGKPAFAQGSISAEYSTEGYFSTLIKALEDEIQKK